MNIQIDAEKALEKNSTSLYDKSQKKLAIEGPFLNTIKAI
jgi:hypothetical protein